MKNIHLIPTDKPSRLGYLSKKGKEVFKDLRLFDKLMPIILDSENQNIYIISDEKLKSGDWTFYHNPNTKRKLVVKCKNVNSTYFDYEKLTLEIRQIPIDWGKKIILTTDQDLIANGVQAINDEFLEWFVKNPNCEDVEIKPNWEFLGDDYREGGEQTLIYNIIISKEESKSHPFCETPEQKCTMNYCDENGCLNRKRELLDIKEEPKKDYQPSQGEKVWIKVFSNWSEGIYIGYDITTNKYLVRENVEGGSHLLSSNKILPYNAMPNKPKPYTLEEAAEQFANSKKWMDGHVTNWVQYTFKEGAKWQQKKIYNEESYQDALNIQKTSNAGYESKIFELEQEIKRMYSEEDILFIIDKYQVECQLKYNTGTVPDDKEWFEQYKKK